jgi:hypothetical protein
MKYCSQSVILSKQFTLLSIFLIKFEEISTADNSAIKFYYEKKNCQPNKKLAIF